MSTDERVYVGSKPILAYVTAVLTAFSRADSVNVMARGRAISLSLIHISEPTRPY